VETRAVAWRTGTFTNHPYVFLTNNTIVGTFSTAGYFGIGSTTPYGVFAVSLPLPQARSPMVAVTASSSADGQYFPRLRAVKEVATVTGRTYDI